MCVGRRAFAYIKYVQIMKKIAIITARSGSKGLRNKNMLMVDGKPVLAYSIEAALDSGIFDKIILTTDSQEYIDFLSYYPIDFVKRAPHLATDKASSYQVLEDVLLRYSWYDYDYFALLQPTTPMRTAQHCIDVCRAFEERYEDFDFLASVTEASKPTVLTHVIDEDLSMKHWSIDYSNYYRQMYPTEYSANGVFYIAKPGAYLQQKHFYGARSMAYKMDKFVSVDIDTRHDFEYFYFLMQQSKREELLLAQAKREIKLKDACFGLLADVSLLGGSLLALFDHSEYTSLRIQNLAITAALADPYRSLVLQREDLTLAKKVVLDLGRDDLRKGKGSPKEIAHRVEGVLELLLQRDSEIKVCLLECLKGLFRVDYDNTQVQVLNELLQAISQKYERVHWVSLNEHFVDSYGKLSRIYTSDGLNLNTQGYDRLYEILSPILKP